MPPKVTLKEIAREVGLSATAVSLVLNNKPCKVSPENKQRIKEVARKKHYIPNQIARSLVMQQSHTLGLVVPNIESRFFSSLAKNLEIRCRERGYALFITNSDGVSANDADLVKLLVNRGIDGLFLVVSDELGADAQLLDDLHQLPIPCIMVDRIIEGHTSCDRVRFDNNLGGYLACKHLIEHGHTRIACLANLNSNTGRERVEGYTRALTETGIEADSSLILESDYYITDGYKAAARLMHTDATAVIATSDNIALGLLKHLYEKGKRIPRDYSVVSYDNSAADILFEPALSSIEQNVEELSEAAISAMLSRLEEYRAQSELSEAKEYLLKPRLIIKDSVSELG